MRLTSLLLLFSTLPPSTTSIGGGPGGGAAAGSGRGFGRGPIGDYKCYQVCPPIVYPTGHDPYYDTAY
jgi:hypothetical protein